MSVREIMSETLSYNRYDGLFNDGISCACLMDDLMPCNNDCIATCEPGYKVPCPNEGDCDCDPKDPHAWHVVAER